LKIKTVQLHKNLRRDLLRGHPWVYSQALKPSAAQTGELVEVLDQKGKLIGWGYYSSEGPIGLRMVSLGKRPPKESDLQQKIQESLQRRSFLNPKVTNGYRAIQGEGDGLPGLICDLYDSIAVIQFDGEVPERFWRQYPIIDWISSATNCPVVVNKTRGNFKIEKGNLSSSVVEILENNLRFLVDVEKGQKTGFFFDQRDNRNYLKDFCSGLEVMNLFSYTGGFSLYAGAGGAKRVLSVDLAKPALDLAQKSWDLNSFEGHHECLAIDVFEELSRSQELWDMVIVDPPSMAHSEKQRSGALSKYVEVFSMAAKRVKPGGHLVMSSCSSHVSFEDFHGIVTESLSKASRRGNVLRVSGQGADHPFPQACPEMRYLKFYHVRMS
tara:strand:+ start:364 stop:1509 length:1146 start_codon:yes stop_codon:yes gene_type:complete